MRIEEIKWDEESVFHIARHGIEPSEVEEACFENRPFVLKARHNRYFALGQAKSGRHLTIVFEYLGYGNIKIVTARPMSNAERKFYQRRK